MEWILLGIAVISSLSHLSLRLRGLPRELPAQGMVWLLGMSLASLFCVLSLGLLGCRLPVGSAGLPGKSRRPSSSQLGGWVGNAEVTERRRSKGQHLQGQDRLVLPILYVAGGFVLSWLAIILSGRGMMLFPPLLLIVVTRGCVIFPRVGRWFVAGTALMSFVAMQYLALQRIRFWGIPLERLPRVPGARRLPEDLLHSLRLNAMVNVTLLFALVLGFVLLLVGALIQEEHSRQQLAQANQQLRRYSLRIEDQAALQERSRIAREIHDTVGHCLTAQSIQLENAALQLDRTTGQVEVTQAAEHLNTARRLGREALQNVRQAVARLRVHPLKGQSLGQAVNKLVQEFQQHNSIQLESSLDLQVTPSQDIAIVLYRILQEGLTNLTRHSEATVAQLDIYRDAQGLHLRLSDNGRGFEPSQNTTGFGLQSMSERAAAVQGRFKLVSAPGEGCRLELDLPL